VKKKSWQKKVSFCLLTLFLLSNFDLYSLFVFSFVAKKWSKNHPPKTDLGHLVGYIPHRGDFETEYDNDAELILADMDFKEEDTKKERGRTSLFCFFDLSCCLSAMVALFCFALMVSDLKLKVLEIYNSKLDARVERKKFILDRGLLNAKVPSSFNVPS
jgi:hypothetical protein